MFQEITQLLALTVVMVGSLHNYTVRHVATSPLSWDEVVVGIIPVDESILHPGISHVHQIVQAYMGGSEHVYSPWCMLHCHHQNLETVCQYPKGILNHSTCP